MDRLWLKRTARRMQPAIGYRLSLGGGLQRAIFFWFFFFVSSLEDLWQRAIDSVRFLPGNWSNQNVITEIWRHKLVPMSFDFNFSDQKTKCFYWLLRLKLISLVETNFRKYFNFLAYIYYVLFIYFLYCYDLVDFLLVGNFFYI